MNKYIIMILLQFIVCCKEDKKSLEEQKKRDIINIALEDKLKKFIEFNSDTIFVYRIEFANNNLFSSTLHNDTLISISYLFSCEPENNTGYKGILKVDDYNIAIIDKNNVGTTLYDTNRLLKIPLNQLKCNTTKFIYVLSLKFQNGNFYEIDCLR